MNIKKMFCLVLALAMALAMMACGGNGTDDTTAENTTGTTETAEVTTPEELVVPEQNVENPVTYFSFTLSGEDGQAAYMYAYDNGDGTTGVEINGEERKKGSVQGDVLGYLTLALEQSGLTALNGMETYEEGGSFASLYVDYADGTCLTANYSGGAIPEELSNGYAAMEEAFAYLTANLPVYVPMPEVQGEVDAALLDALNGVLLKSGIENLDTLVISQVALDEYFAEAMGLSGSEGITAGALCSPMMNVTPYSLAIVAVEDESVMEGVCDDFAANVSWNKWVCVSATDAIVAQKDNMVLCLMASDELFTLTQAAIENSGWTIVEQLNNPAM